MHLSLPKQFPLFILASSVCWSLQCLISTLTQGGGGSHLFRLPCSVMLWGGRGTANKCPWRVWGVRAVSRPHWVCPRSRRVCFPGLHCSGSRLLFREQALGYVHFSGLSCSGSGSRVLHKGADSDGPAFCARPRSEQLRRLVSAVTPGAGSSHRITSPSQPLSFLGGSGRARLRCAVCLL